MTEQCCMGGPASGRLALRLLRHTRKSGAPVALARISASILPAAAWVFLPKCPLCLAAWLTAATGISFSAVGAVWASGTVVVFWAAAVVFAAMPGIRRRAFWRAPASLRRLH